MVKDADSANTIFCVSKNYIYDTALSAADVPYGTKGFITVKKGGDARVFLQGQAVDGAWANSVEFQNSVGYKPGDVQGTPTAGDPAAPSAPLKFP